MEDDNEYEENENEVGIAADGDEWMAVSSARPRLLI